MRPRFIVLAVLVLVPSIVIACVGDDATSSNGGPTSGDDASSDVNNGGDDSATDSGIDGGSGTVSGNVVDYGGAAISGAIVRIGKTHVTTDGTGAFTIPDAPATYDIDVVQISATENVIVSYRGATTRTPTITTNGSSESTSLVPTLSSVVNASDSVQLFFQGNGETQNIANIAGPIPAGGAIPAHLFDWSGSLTTTGVFGVFELTTDAQKNPASFLAYSFQNYNATAASDAGLSCPLTAMTSGQITGTVISPPATYLLQAEVSSTYLKGPQKYYEWGSPPSPDFTIPTPIVPGAKINIVGVAIQNGGKLVSSGRVNDLDTTASGVNISFPPSSDPISPPDVSTGIDTTTPFKWTAQPGTTTIEILCVATHFSAEITLLGTTTTLPDTSDLGLPLPSGASCEWSVNSFPTTPAMDSWLGTPAQKLARLRQPNVFSGLPTFTTK